MYRMQHDHPGPVSPPTADGGPDAGSNRNLSRNNFEHAEYICHFWFRPLPKATWPVPIRLYLSYRLLRPFIQNAVALFLLVAKWRIVI